MSACPTIDILYAVKNDAVNCLAIVPSPNAVKDLWLDNDK